MHIGKVCERIAPSLPGFNLNARDCRPLWEPIDFMAFPGLNANGVAERVVFLEVKTGNARLNAMQSAIASAVQAGKVRLTVMPVTEGGRGRQ